MAEPDDASGVTPAERSTDVLAAAALAATDVATLGALESRERVAILDPIAGRPYPVAVGRA